MPNSFGSLVSEVAKNHTPTDPIQPHGLIVSSFVHEHILRIPAMSAGCSDAMSAGDSE